MSKIHAVSAMILTGLLSGCAGMNHRFDCPMTPGVHCQAIHQVHQTLNQPKTAKRPQHWQLWINAHRDAQGKPQPAHRLTIKDMPCPCH